jgi:LuxR family transcriptional regulator, maltose regulon positive regulatory protein
MAEAQQLRFASADRYYLDAPRLAEQHVGPNSVAAALAASLIARIRYEQGRLDEAESLLIYRAPLINGGTLLDCVLSAYSVMAGIAAHRMNLEWAHTLLELAENRGNARGWGRLSAAAILERARLFRNEGRIDECAGCIKRLERLAAEYIAKDLAIAPETVKSHMKNIFIKLKVERRAQAVSRAQILGLAGTRT